MYVELAHQLGYRTKLASRTRAGYALFGLLPQAQNPVLHEIQAATGNALTGAFAAETVTDLLQKDNLRGQAAIVGSTVGLGQHLGARFLPKRLFPQSYAKAIAGVPAEKLPEAEKLLRSGAGFSRKQISAGRGLGALAGLVTGLLAAYGVGQLKKREGPEDQK